MNINSITRVPPQNIEAEQCVLGSMMLDAEVITVVAEMLKKEDFYKKSHREIFESVISLFDKSVPVDLITLTDDLKQRGLLEAVGGLEYVTNIAYAVPTTANIVYYARIVEEKSLSRKLIKASSDITNAVYEATEDIPTIIDKAEKSIFDILQKRNTKGFTHIKDMLLDAVDRLEVLYNNKDKVTGIPTGFIELDNKISGLQKSDLILIAARPAMGKTAFALNIAQNAAVNSNITTAVFSLEMSKEQLANRFLSSEVMIKNHKMKTGDLEDEDWHKIAVSLSPLSASNVYVDDTPGINITEMRAKCRRLKLEKNLGLVVIDYIQLMHGRRRTDNRQQEISEISRGLKVLAKEIDVPVIALSQLSRAPEARADHRPILSDLRESGAIEQDADIVMFLYRDDYYYEDSEKKNVADVIIAKHRNGETGTVELRWFGEYTKFGNLAKRS
jgi:replicative DNA helicase